LLYQYIDQNSLPAFSLGFASTWSKPGPNPQP
jgi:hypothetical protein